MSTSQDSYSVPITRWFIDTRPLHPADPKSTNLILPLLSALTSEEQANITRFYQPKDKLMSLASTLLKFLFIHQTARIPWSEVVISRWPAPHKRPYWSPPTFWPRTYGLEFNVSHQAGLTALMGCQTQDRDSSSRPGPDLSTTGDSTSEPSPASPPRLGVDITCTDEAHRGPRNIITITALAQWIDIFSEMFSAQERRDMLHAPVSSVPPTHGEQTHVTAKLRRFYAYWSLKEAYIKMVGEGLLASWLRELEFSDVTAPDVVASADQDADAWGPAIKSTSSSNPAGFQVTLYKKTVDDVAMELVAYGSSFIIATAMKGVADEKATAEQNWRKVDIERDIRPCAEGRCTCLQ